MGALEYSMVVREGGEGNQRRLMNGEPSDDCLLAWKPPEQLSK